MLSELKHYAEFYDTFLHGNSNYSPDINEYLEGLRLLKQTTVYLFLFRVFDDYQDGVIDQKQLEKVLRMLLNYSIRRLMCDISSNSLRGFYKTLYNRVFVQPENKNHYYDSVVSFMQQTTSRDAIPSDSDFAYALKNNNLYRKHALCRYLLIGIENQGKEKVVTDSLSIEHVMPQNKNLSTAWQRMLGENWALDKDRWLHTLGNLTLTGYNSELGDRPFHEKKKMIEENQTKIVNLYKDIQDKDAWNADTIQARADRLVGEVLKLYPIEKADTVVSFVDPKYKEYTCAEPGNATYKTVNYYELEGERVSVDSFASMVKSVAKKLYDKDPSVIERMAKNLETFSDWVVPVFSYDPNNIKSGTKLEGTKVYISTGYSAYDCVSFIRGLLRKYDLDIEEDFIYSAKATISNSSDINEPSEAKPLRKKLRKEYWTYALPIIQDANSDRGSFSNCSASGSNTISGFFGIGGFCVCCIANYDGARIDFYLGKGNKSQNKEAFDLLFNHKEEIEKKVGIELNWDRADQYKASWFSCYLPDVSVTNKADWPSMAEFHAKYSNRLCEVVLPYLAEKYMNPGEFEHQARIASIAKSVKAWALEKSEVNLDLSSCSRTYLRFKTPYMDELIPETPDYLSGWNTANHYFYEVRNYDGSFIYIQLAFSSKNLLKDQRAIIDKINEYYPSKKDNENWKWRLPFRTKKYYLDDDASEASIKEAMNKCYADILEFENTIKDNIEF